MFIGFDVVSHLFIKLLVFILNALQFFEFPSGKDVLFFRSLNLNLAL